MFDRDPNRSASGWNYFPAPIKYKVVMPGYNSAKIIVVARNGETSSVLTATWQLYQLYMRLSLV